MEVNAARAEPGKRLFHDDRLSGDASPACASCRQPDKAFTDGKALTDAYARAAHFRSAPTPANGGYRGAWLHDGRLGADLNDVSREVITETCLMNMDMRIMQERLKQDPVHAAMVQAACMKEPSNDDARNALINIMKTMVSRGAPVDAGTLSASAERRRLMFDGKAGCAACHSGPRHADDKPRDTVGPDTPDIWADPARHSAFVTYARFMGVENYLNLREDPGAYPRNTSPEKLPGRRRRAMDADRHLMAGRMRLAHVIGAARVQAMRGPQSLRTRFDELTARTPRQVDSFDRGDIIATLKRRVVSGGMAVWNQHIRLIAPIGARHADIVFPASGWGEETFTRANGDRCIRLCPRFHDAPGDVMPDWRIIARPAGKMGFEGVDWENSNDVLEEGARRSRGSRKDFNMVHMAAKREGKTPHEKLGEVGANGIQNPVMMLDDGSLEGAKRLHDTTCKLPETGPSRASAFN